MNTAILRKTITIVAVVTVLLCGIASAGAETAIIMVHEPAGTTGPLPGPAALHIKRARAITLRSCHIMTDGGGYRWDIQYNGNVYWGTNRAYAGAMYCKISGSNFQAPGYAGWVNKTGDEIEMGPHSRNGLRICRRVKVYKKRALARWLDIFHNPSTAPITVSILMHSCMTHPISKTLTDTGRAAFGEKDSAFITQVSNNTRPSILHVVTSKGAKLRPTVTARSNKVYLKYSLTVPPKKTVILCHFESQNRNVSDHQKLMKNFPTYRLLSDLPGAMRQMIVNMRVLYASAPLIPRNAKLDCVRPLDGSVLLGTIENRDWSITTSYGKFKIPAARVVGFLSKAPARGAASQPASSDIQVLLIDGQVLAGRLSAPSVRLKLPNDQVLKIPSDQIKQCGYRISPERPAGVGEVYKGDKKFPATVLLRSGDYLAWDSSGATMRFKSACGTLELSPEIVSSIAPAKNNMWRVNLKDSSSITGALASEDIRLKLQLGKEISVPDRSVAFLAFPGAIAKPPNATAVLLRNGDRLLGKVSAKQLSVRTDYGSVNIPMADVWKIKLQADHTAELTTQRLTVLRGKLPAGNLPMVLGSGVKLSVPVERIDSITFPRKLPAELVRKIEALIKELGNASAAKRKAAVQKLIAMGKDILVVLKRHSKSTSPLVSKGVKEVIDTLEGRVKPKAPVIHWNLNGADIPMPVTSVVGNRSGDMGV